MWELGGMIFFSGTFGNTTLQQIHGCRKLTSEVVRVKCPSVSASETKDILVPAKMTIQRPLKISGNSTRPPIHGRRKLTSEVLDEIKPLDSVLAVRGISEQALVHLIRKTSGNTLPRKPASRSTSSLAPSRTASTPGAKG